MSFSAAQFQETISKLNAGLNELSPLWSPPSAPRRSR